MLAAAATLIAALARPLDLLLCCALGMLTLTANSGFFDAAWPFLHRNAVFEVAGAPLRVDGLCIKLNGYSVQNEAKLWGVPKQGAGARRPLTVLSGRERGR